MKAKISEEPKYFETRFNHKAPADHNGRLECACTPGFGKCLQCRFDDLHKRDAESRLRDAAPAMLEALKKVRDFYEVMGFTEAMELSEIIKQAEGSL